MSEPKRRVDGPTTDAEKIRILESHYRACWACIQVGAEHHCQHLKEQAQEIRPIDVTPFMSTVTALNDAGLSGRPNSVSPIETHLLEAFWRAGLEPLQQYGIAGYVVDFAFPRARLVVEADGAEYHQDAERERIRDEAIRRAGWHIVHFAGRDIFDHADECVMQVYRLARSSLV